MAYTVEVLTEKCIGCGICARICPTGTLKMDKETKKAYNTDIFCDNAWGCLYACPVSALEIVEAK
jgi:energy-converting hydrogenase A subunit P